MEKEFIKEEEEIMKEVEELNKEYNKYIKELEKEMKEGLIEMKEYNEKIEKKQLDKKWKLIKRIVDNTPNCWAEVTRLDIDFCRIQIKGTDNKFEINLKGALDIIKDMFGVDIENEVK